MRVRLVLAAAITAVAVAALLGSATASTQAARWYKGNTHTHTLNSDGDSTPDDVVRWYREHGYQFLVLSDHNYLTDTSGLTAVHGAAEKFLLIPGEEVTDTFENASIHVNGLNLSTEVAPQHGTSTLDVIQRDVNVIRKAGGVPHINHPNYRWSITTDELRQVQNNKLFEIYNGHPEVNNLGGGGVPGLEEIWDAILSKGVLLYGIAVDDAHVFKDPGNPQVAGPGRGWVVVRAPRLEGRAIVDAMERGDFYASTGVVLNDYQASRERITVDVKVQSLSRYRIQFIGAGGKVLSEVAKPVASYDIKGNEGYVRARVIESNGRMAWCQPVLTSR